MKQRFNRNVVLCRAIGIAGAFASVAPASADITEYFVHADFTAAIGAPVIATFDGFPAGNGTFTGNEYVGSGLTIVQRDGVAMNLLAPGGNQFCPITNFNSLPNALSSSTGGNEFNCFFCSDNFDFIFSTPTHAAGVWIANIAPGTTVVEFLGPNKIVIASEEFANDHPGIISGGTSDWDNRIFYGLKSTVPITAIRTVDPPQDGDGILYDDVQWVPGTPADLNGDTKVNALDLAILLGAWGPRGGADLDGDGVTNAADLAILLGAWAP